MNSFKGMDKNSIHLFFALSISFFCLILIKGMFFNASALLFVALILLYKYRDDLDFDKAIYNIAYLLIGYFLFFSVFSDYHRLSVKGSYDFIRGLLVLPVAFLFFKTTDLKKYNLYFQLIVVLYLLGNFYFSHSWFWGYHENPNNTSVDMFLAMFIGLILTNKDQKVSLILSFIIAVTALFLIFTANSRALIAGLFIGSVFALYTGLKSFKIKIFIVSVLTTLFSFFMIYFNRKGFGLSLRDEIWQSLFSLTMDNHPLIGTGINSTKAIMIDNDIYTHTAHNIFLEVFVTSGFVGLAFFIFILYKMLRYLFTLNYHKDFRFFSSVIGLVTMAVYYQFDLKLASYSFTGITMIMLAGLLLSIRRTDTGQ